MTHVATHICAVGSSCSRHARQGQPGGSESAMGPKISFFGVPVGLCTLGLPRLRCGAEKVTCGAGAVFGLGPHYVSQYGLASRPELFGFSEQAERQQFGTLLAYSVGSC